MPNTRSKNKKISADTLAEMADAGEDITAFFKPGEMKQPMKDIVIMPDVQRVNVDFAKPMLHELDVISAELNVSRQSLIKTWLRDSLDKYYQNKKIRKA